jgi:hypothetical protein
LSPANDAQSRSDTAACTCTPAQARTSTHFADGRPSARPTTTATKSRSCERRWLEDQATSAGLLPGATLRATRSASSRKAEWGSAYRRLWRVQHRSGGRCYVRLNCECREGLRRVRGGVDQYASACAARQMSGSLSQSPSATYARLVGPTGAGENTEAGGRDAARPVGSWVCGSRVGGRAGGCDRFGAARAGRQPWTGVARRG